MENLEELEANDAAGHPDDKTKVQIEFEDMGAIEGFNLFILEEEEEAKDNLKEAVTNFTD
jgi:hypothetical protein